MRTQTAAPDDPRRCENCRYFYQHYIKRKLAATESYVPCRDGHCHYARRKIVRRNNTCDAFEPVSGEDVCERDLFL